MRTALQELEDTLATMRVLNDPECAQNARSRELSEAITTLEHAILFMRLAVKGETV